MTPNYKRLLYEVAELIIITDNPSFVRVQEKFQMNANKVDVLFYHLENAGIVSRFGGSIGREILIRDLNKIKELINKL